MVDALVSEASGVTPVGVRLSSRARSKREKPVRQRTGFFVQQKRVEVYPEAAEVRGTSNSCAIGEKYELNHPIVPIAVAKRSSKDANKLYNSKI